MTGRIGSATSIGLSSLSLLLVLFAGLTASQIALNTPYGAHPDEVIHGDAFCFYESNWWPPDLNSDELLYSPDGWSRVYNAELVYFVYGRLAQLSKLLSGLFPEDAQPSALQVPDGGNGDQIRGTYQLFLPLVSAPERCAAAYQTYRLLNVALYLITLLIVFYLAKEMLWLGALGLLLLVIPQVTYVYSYVNSDAWGLSFGIFLILFAHTRAKSFRTSRLDIIVLGLLTALVILAKEPFWVLIPFAYLPVGIDAVKMIRAKDKIQLRQVALNLGILAAVILAIVAPLRFVYPFLQNDYATQVVQMRETRSRYDFKPSQPTYPGYLLASKGVPFHEILKGGHFAKSSAKSFYAMFGHMTIALPLWLYWAAALCLSLGVLLTIGFAAYAWQRIPTLTRALLIGAPMFITLNIFASMYHSWTFDLQPQGRYLLPSLLPLAVLMGSTIALEPRWLRTTRLLSWTFLYVLGLYGIWFVLLRDIRI